MLSALEIVVHPAVVGVDRALDLQVARPAVERDEAEPELLLRGVVEEGAPSLQVPLPQAGVGDRIPGGRLRRSVARAAARGSGVRRHGQDQCCDRHEQGVLHASLLERAARVRVRRSIGPVYRSPGRLRALGAATPRKAQSAAGGPQHGPRSLLDAGARELPRHGAQVRGGGAAAARARVRRDGSHRQERSSSGWASSGCSGCATTRAGAARGSTGRFTAVLFEELARCDNAGVTMGISVHTDMATPSLHQFGSDELQAALPGAGDPRRDGGGDRRHRARRRLRRRRHQDPRGARRRRLGDQRQQDLHHQRRHADWLCLLAVTDPDAGYGGFSQIIVPTDVAGLPLRAARQDRQLGLGHRPALLRGRARSGRQHHRRDRPRLPAADDAVPGRAPGRLRQRERRLAAALGADAGVVRGARALRQAAHEDAGDAVQVRRDADADHRGARARPTPASASASRARTRPGDLDGEDLLRPHGAQVADECIQLHGGYGYMRESAAGRAFVDTPADRIGGGADETMIQYLAKMLGF